MTAQTHAIDLNQYQAVLFDLDGVLTRTAVVHAHAWRQLFDEYLQAYSAKTGQACEAFDIEQDYRKYVDGKPRYEGVHSFLQARGIDLPWGQQNDGPEKNTIYGLGNRKDRYFQAQLREKGVNVYKSTVDVLKLVRRRGMKTAVVSSSKHCREVLEVVGLTPLFDTSVDGVELQRLQLRGKPAPDTFLEAARRLGVTPPQAIVIEDALAGVVAGRTGGFGLVIALDRQRQADLLRKSGADFVVEDLAELFPEAHSAAEPSAS